MSRLKDYTKVLTLAAVTVASLALEWLYFGFPSTLLIYLTLLLITTPVYILLQLLTFNKVKKSRPRLVTLALTMLAFLYLITQPTYPSSGPGSELNNQHPVNNSTSSYFFSANFYNSEDILPDFFDQFMQLSDYLGRDSVYLSIYESNSRDNTKELLHQFDDKLDQFKIAHTVITDSSTQKPFFVGNERINYLASVRNLTLAPLTKELDEQFNYFDKVVFLNDVFYDWFSVVRLLNTRNGLYDQVCAFDYFKIGLYDTWVTRDTCSRRTKVVWPYFQDEHSISLLRQGKPVPVNSCWNGITAFDAKWFVESRDNGIKPIRFRVLDECVTSECLLSSYDMHLKSDKQPEIYMNPLVPTGELAFCSFHKNNLTL